MLPASSKIIPFLVVVLLCTLVVVATCCCCDPLRANLIKLYCEEFRLPAMFALSATATWSCHWNHNSSISYQANALVMPEPWPFQLHLPLNSRSPHSHVYAALPPFVALSTAYIIYNCKLYECQRIYIRYIYTYMANSWFSLRRIESEEWRRGGATNLHIHSHLHFS